MSHYTTLISAEQLRANLNNPDWVVFDCRSYLTEPAKGRVLYQQGHLPGARFLDMETELSGPVTPVTGRHPLPDFTQLATTLASLGVSQTTQVVVYDDMCGAMAARLWWLLRYLGHQAVALLDGGLASWQAMGGELSQVVPRTEAGDFYPRPWSIPYFSTSQVEQHHALLPLVDARAEERFRGINEPVDPVAGHIPGALNRPFERNLDQHGCFKSAAQLHQEWQQLVPLDQPLIHMCGSGVTACLNLLACEHAGISGGILYAGSWSEWIRDSARPVGRSL